MTTKRYENINYEPGPAIQDEEVQSTRTLALSMLQVFRAIGMPAPEETSLPHRVLRLCNEVERLDRACWKLAEERDEAKSATAGLLTKLEAVQADSNRALDAHRESLDGQHRDHLADLRRLGGEMQAAVDEQGRKHAYDVNTLSIKVNRIDAQASRREHVIRVLRSALREALDIAKSPTIENSDNIDRLENVCAKAGIEPIMGDRDTVLDSVAP